MNSKPCKHEIWAIIDDEWNHDFVCEYDGRFCTTHDCPHYEPKEVEE